MLSPVILFVCLFNICRTDGDGQKAKFYLTYFNKLHVFASKEGGGWLMFDHFWHSNKHALSLFFFFFKVQLSLYQIRLIQPSRSGL